MESTERKDSGDADLLGLSDLRPDYVPPAASAQTAPATNKGSNDTFSQEERDRRLAISLQQQEDAHAAASMPESSADRTASTAASAAADDAAAGTIEVNVVELGRPLDATPASTPASSAAAGASGRGRNSDFSKRRRRRQSPVARFLKASMKPVVKQLDNSLTDRLRKHSPSRRRSGQPQHQQPGKRPSRRRQGKSSGEKIYQGKTARRAQQIQEEGQQQQPQQRPLSPQHQEQSQSAAPAPTSPPPEQQSSAQINQRQRHSKKEKGYAPDDRNVAPWAKIRRKSRDKADQIRLRLSDAQTNMRRRASQEANDAELERLRALRDDARKRRQSRTKKEGTNPDASDTARIAKINAEMGYERRLSMENRTMSNRDNRSNRDNIGGSSRRKAGPERRLSQSIGHTPKREDGLGEGGKDKPPKRLSKSLYDGDAPSASDDDSSQSPALEKGQQPSRSAAREDGRPKLRSGSLDTSMRNLGKGVKEEDKKKTSPGSRRTTGMRRKHSLDSSMKDVTSNKEMLGGTAPAKKEEDKAIKKSSPPPVRGRLPRRTSLDSSIRHLNLKVGEDKDKDGRKSGQHRRRRSLDSSLKLTGSGTKLPHVKAERRRSNSAGPELRLSGAEYKPLSARDRATGPPDDARTNHRKTHTGVVGRNDEAGREDRRRSESDAAQRKSDYAKKLEARMASTKKKQKRRSTKKDQTVDGSRRGSGVASGVATAIATDDDAEDSVDSQSESLPGSTLSDDDAFDRAKNRWSKVRLSPAVVCTLCLCYCISIVLFCGLGFWLHMEFGAKDADASNAGTSTAENVEPPSLGQSGNDTIQLNATVDGGVTTKSSSAAPNYFPSSMPSAPPTEFPSYMPSTSLPSASPSYHPTSSPSSSMQPSHAPSDMPTLSPTTIPGCPEQLLKSISLDDTLTLKYEVVIYSGPAMEGGGLLCASLEYSGGAAGWMGLALSEATRNPAFGRKEAIIGLPGIRTSVAVAAGGGATLGQQIAALEGGPAFVNPGKYSIPAGGVGDNAYSGPSLSLLADADKQTLMNGAVSVVDAYATGGIIMSDESEVLTQMTFAKYLQEPGEIEIDPFGSTLLLYAVAVMPGSGDEEYDNDPEWKSTYVTLLESSSSAKSGLVRKRTRRHHDINDM